LNDQTFENGIQKVEAVFNREYTQNQKLVYFQCLNETPDEVWVKAIKEVCSTFRQYGQQYLPLPVHFIDAIKIFNQSKAEHEIPIDQRIEIERQYINKKKGASQ
jgi:hypothetical protein